MRVFHARHSAVASSRAIVCARRSKLTPQTYGCRHTASRSFGGLIGGLGSFGGGAVSARILQVSVTTGCEGGDLNPYASYGASTSS